MTHLHSRTELHALTGEPQHLTPPLQVTPDPSGAPTRRSQTSACVSPCNLCGASFSGKFREKASILHKIAKKKCQVEDSEKANGVASRSGTKGRRTHRASDHDARVLF